MVALLVFILFELSDNESTAVFIFAWDKFEFVLVFVFAPFVLVPSVDVEFEPFKRVLTTWDEVASLFVLFVLVAFWTDVVEAFTAAEAVATPARVAAADAGKEAPPVLDDVDPKFEPTLFEVIRECCSFSFESIVVEVAEEVERTLW